MRSWTQKGQRRETVVGLLRGKAGCSATSRECRPHPAQDFIRLLFDAPLSLPLLASGMYYVASCFVPTSQWSQSLVTCRVRWPALPSIIRTSTWTAGWSLSLIVVILIHLFLTCVIDPFGYFAQRRSCSAGGRFRHGLRGGWHALRPQHDVFGKTLPPRYSV